MRVIRILMAVIVGLIVVVGLVPLLVLLDLVGGGTGWGLCPTGLDSCATSYFDGPELLAVLVIAILVLVGSLRALVNLRRLIERRRAETPLSRSVSRGDGFGGG